MNNLLESIIVSMLAIPICVLTPACEDAEEAWDCAKICEAYDDCVDDDIDVIDCADSCEEQADADDDFADRVFDCEECIDDGACAEKVFQCSTRCAGVVPQ